MLQKKSKLSKCTSIVLQLHQHQGWLHSIFMHPTPGECKKMWSLTSTKSCCQLFCEIFVISPKLPKYQGEETKKNHSRIFYEQILPYAPCAENIKHFARDWQGLMPPHPNRRHDNLHTAVPESAGPHPKNFRELYPNLPAQADNARVQLHLPEKSLAPGTPDKSPCHTSSSIFLTSIKNSPPPPVKWSRILQGIIP